MKQWDTHIRRTLPVFALGIILITALLTLITPAKVSALAGAYNASDVLGQSDFDTNYYNGTPSSIIPGAPGATGNTSPQGAVIDTVNHRLFVADSQNNRVLVYNLDSNNVALDKYADNVLGQSDFTSSDTDTNAKGFSSPDALAYDSTHNRLFVGDYANSRVLIFDTTSITDNEDAVNVLGQPDFTSGGSDTNAKGFYGPFGLVYDNTNNRLFVSEYYNHRILVFDTTSITNNEDAVNVLGQADFTSSGSDTNAKGFNNPRGLAYDEANNRLFVADSLNHRVLVFDTTSITNNEDAVNVLGQSDFTSSGGDTNAKGFYKPYGLAYDATDNRLFVADEENHRVLVFDTTTITDNEDAVNVLGEADFTSSGIIDNNAKGFYNPAGLSYDNAGEQLFVADRLFSRVLIFDTTSITNNEDAVNVLGQKGFVSSGGATMIDADPDTIEYADPNASGLDTYYGGGTTLDTTHHRLFVTDSSNGRILIFNLDENNNLIDKVADNVLGSDNFTDTWGLDLPGYLNYPGTTAYDEVNNRLFVSDQESNCRVLVFDLSGGITNGMDASYAIGQPDLETTDCGTAQNQLEDAYGTIAFDSTAQRLYVKDTYNNYRIMVFDVAPDEIANGMDASYVIGAPDFDTVGNGGCYSRNEIGGGYGGGLIVDPEHHRLFYSDYDCSNVKVFDTSNLSNGMDASYVLGCDDLDCNDYSTGAAYIDYAYNLSYDAEQQLLFVYGYSCYGVSIFDLKEITNGEAAIGALGQTAPGTCDGDDYYVPSQNTFYSEYGSDSAFDSTNRRLYWADDYNNRVLIFDFVNITTTSLTNATQNSAYSQPVTVTGDQGDLSFEVESGSLPAGLSLNPSTGVISGTPTGTGTSNFTIKATDDNGGPGTFTDTQSLSITVQGQGGGSEDDYNNDGTPDEEQPNVSSLINPVNGKRTVLEVSEDCEINDLAVINESEIDGNKDTTYNYPAGLMNFTIDCADPGTTATITQYYYGVTGDYIVRKHKPGTGFFTIESASQSNQTINDQPVKVVSYQVTDGGNLDLDGEVNGTIVDPVGLATKDTSDLAQTGMNQQLLLMVAAALTVGGGGVMARRKYNLNMVG